MSPIIKEVIDSKEGNICSEPSNPTPSIAELRESQRKGSEGSGTSEQTLGEKFADFNQGTGVSVDD